MRKSLTEKEEVKRGGERKRERERKKRGREKQRERGKEREQSENGYYLRDPAGSCIKRGCDNNSIELAEERNRGGGSKQEEKEY